MKIKSLAVYCGTSTGLGPDYARAAAEFGEQAARRGITLVYGGCNVGLMGALADGALRASGKVIGVMPRPIGALNITHTGLTDLRMVETMHDRKRLMAELADGFVALPGGIGTMEEMLEMLTWRQLELHAKPCGLLNTEGFFNGLVGFLDHMAGQGFLAPGVIERLVVHGDGEALLRQLEAGI